MKRTLLLLVAILAVVTTPALAAHVVPASKAEHVVTMPNGGRVGIATGSIEASAPAIDVSQNPLVTTWSSAVGSHTLSTPKLVEESVSHWSKRHKDALAVLQQDFPPLPPPGH